MFEFNPSEEESKWLKNCITGVLRKEFSWEAYHEEMQEECGDLCDLITMGDDVILIHNKTGNTNRVFETDFDEWLSHWFEWYRDWEASDVSHKRLVWTRWIGAPVHAWNPRFFENISGRIGRFIKLDRGLILPGC